MPLLSKEQKETISKEVSALEPLISAICHAKDHYYHWQKLDDDDQTDYGTAVELVAKFVGVRAAIKTRCQAAIDYLDAL